MFCLARTRRKCKTSRRRKTERKHSTIIKIKRERKGRSAQWNRMHGLNFALAFNNVHFICVTDRRHSWKVPPFEAARLYGRDTDDMRANGTRRCEEPWHPAQQRILFINVVHLNNIFIRPSCTFESLRFRTHTAAPRTHANHIALAERSTFGADDWSLESNRWHRAQPTIQPSTCFPHARAWTKASSVMHLLGHGEQELAMLGGGGGWCAFLPTHVFLSCLPCDFRLVLLRALLIRFFPAHDVCVSVCVLHDVWVCAKRGSHRNVIIDLRVIHMVALDDNFHPAKRKPLHMRARSRDCSACPRHL